MAKTRRGHQRCGKGSGGKCVSLGCKLGKGIAVVAVKIGWQAGWLAVASVYLVVAVVIIIVSGEFHFSSIVNLVGRRRGLITGGNT